MSTRREAALLVVLTLAALVPFLGKPFNIDDVLFVWLGRHLQAEPWDFYGFAVNWYGTLEPMHEVTKNPPLTGYFVAGAAALLGLREWTLHLAFLLPAVATVLGTWALARRLCGHPLEAAVLAAATPVFLVCATSVMCDVFCLALFSWALAAWMAGLAREPERFGLLVLSGFLAAAAAATKYVGASVVPLCFAWGLLTRRRLGAWCLPLLIPIAALALYEWGTFAAYGRALFLDAAGYASEGGEIGKPAFAVRGAVGLAFLGACVLPAVFLAPFLWSRRVLVAAAGAVALGAWALEGLLRPASEMEATAPPVPLPLETKLQLLVAALGGAGLLAASALDLRRRRDPGSVLLALWLGGIFVFASFLNWTNNGRSILLLAPPAAIVLVRRLEWLWPAAALVPRLRLALVPGLAVALAVAWADARWARSIRDEAARLLARHHRADLPLRFQGHWGFQYYLEQGGARALDLGRDEVAAGERIALAENNVARIQPREAVFRLIESSEQGEPGWVRTHAWPLGAGFYSSVFGPLPYAFGAAPPDRYYVVRAERPLRFAIGPDGRARIEPLGPAEVSAP